jgi:hypothetical protein
VKIDGSECWPRRKRRSYENFAHDTIILCFYVDNCLVRFLCDRGQVIGGALNLWCCPGHTISSSTSPAIKLSPSPFFHDAIPPSVMVGDIAGILNLVMARDADVALSPSISRSGLIVRGEEGRRNVHLRCWKSADLNKGEDDMGADEKRSTVRWGNDPSPRWQRAESRLRTRLSFRSTRAIGRRHVQAVLYISPFFCVRSVYSFLSSYSGSHIGFVTLKTFLWSERPCSIVIDIYIKRLLHWARLSILGAAFARIGPPFASCHFENVVSRPRAVSCLWHSMDTLGPLLLLRVRTTGHKLFHRFGLYVITLLPPHH